MGREYIGRSGGGHDTWRLLSPFDLGAAEGRSAGPSSTSSLICQAFTPISDSQVFTGNGTTELDTASLEDVSDSNHSIDPCLYIKNVPGLPIYLVSQPKNSLT